MKVIGKAIHQKLTGENESHLSAVALRCGKKGESTTLRSHSSNQNIMMNPSGTKFSGDKIFPQSDLRAGTASDRIIKKEVNRIATWNVR
jgi:hypothetical protein